MAKPLIVKILVIPDLHCRHHRVEEIIARTKPRITVFLGDTFDQIGDSPSQNAEAAQWLRHSIHTTGRIHLVGNHDLPYGFDYPRLQRREFGFTRDKFLAINQHMKSVDWACMQVFHIQEPFIFSHAGVQAANIHPMIDLESLHDWLEDEEATFWERMYRDEDHWFLNIGKSRGGEHEFGGPLWSDWKDMTVLPGWHQIFGHTPARAVRTEGDQDGSITCLDTVLQDNEYPSYVGVVTSQGYHHRRTVDVLAGTEYP